MPFAARKAENHLSPETATAQGYYSSSRRASNDIEVLVLDQDGFTNFSNGHNARSYYNSGGYVTTGSIDLNLLARFLFQCTLAR
jgi:Zn/Cd-binding protein ZinT